MAIPVLDGVASFSAPYDLIICDLWGVVHNGESAHPEALKVLAHWRDEGKKVILLSNAPRPREWSIKRMEPMGVTPDYYDEVVTAGDLAHALVSAPEFQKSVGRRLWHLGPAINSPTYDGTGTEEVMSPAEADFAITTAFLDEARETADDYRWRLEEFLMHDLPLVCANPDLEVGQGDVVRPCAGAIAALYEEIGGNVYWCGKPDRIAYETCMALAAAVPLNRVLAIGDGLRTDIAGANGFGIDSLFITSGIHREGLEVARRGPEEVFEAWGATPTAMMAHLTL